MIKFLLLGREDTASLRRLRPVAVSFTQPYQPVLRATKNSLRADVHERFARRLCFIIPSTFGSEPSVSVPINEGSLHLDTYRRGRAIMTDDRVEIGSSLKAEIRRLLVVRCHDCFPSIVNKIITQRLHV